MIKSITFYKGQKKFTNKLYHHKNKDITFNFTDGLNIITGRNGSGKSVLLDMIRNNCGIISDNSYPVMPNPMHLHSWSDDKWISMSNYIKNQFENNDYPNCDIVWDGSMVHYLTPDTFDSERMWNREMARGENFSHQISNDLFSGIEILGKMISHNSKGESSIQVLNKIFNLSIEYQKQLTKKDVNDVWVKASDIFHDWLNSMPRNEKPTLLIDELDSHLDLDNQKSYWNYINYLTQKWQVIVVSHSIFALRLKKSCDFDINYINLNSEYFNKVNKLVL